MALEKDLCVVAHVHVVVVVAAALPSLHEVVGVVGVLLEPLGLLLHALLDLHDGSALRALEEAELRSIEGNTRRCIAEGETRAALC